MSKRYFISALFVAGLAYPQQPTAYTATVVNAMFGTATTMQVQRDGAHGAVEQTTPSGDHIRTFYDLDKHLTYTLTLNHPEIPCGGANFSGDWGDPFETSASMMGDADKAKPATVGNETVNGFATKVLEANVDGAGKLRVWLEPQLKLVVKAALGNQVLFEVKSLKVVKPAASAFVLPATCASAVPPPPTEAQRISRETGDDAANFLNATTSAPSADSCTMIFRAVQAGTMKPLTGFQLAIDTTVQPDHPPAYSTGLSAEGHATYAGGGIKEVTQLVRNGVFRMDNPPANFYLQADFGNSGEASAMIHRACTGKQSVLLLVVKDPAKLGDGADWLWVKAGKFYSAN